MKKYYYFVAHEFSMQERDDLREAIEKAFEKTNLKSYYADIEVRQGYILEKIKDRISRARFGIYDITNTKKPNVFIELGLAIATGKRFYIICKRGTEVPADLAGLDRIEYESYKELTELIKTKIVKVEIEILKYEKQMLRSRQQKYIELSEEEVLKKCVKLYQAEELFHRLGEEIEDKDASNQKAWFLDLVELHADSVYGPQVIQGHLIYGPYENLPEPGTYAAFFKIKVDDNSSMEPFLLLDVTGGSGYRTRTTGYRTRTIRRADFNRPHTYQLFGLEFKYQGGKMEYRAYINTRTGGRIWIDYVAIIKLPV